MQQAKQAGSIVTKFFIAHDNSDPVQLSWMAAEQKQYGDMIIQGELLILDSLQNFVSPQKALQA